MNEGLTQSLILKPAGTAESGSSGWGPALQPISQSSIHDGSTLADVSANSLLLSPPLAPPTRPPLQVQTTWSISGSPAETVWLLQTHFSAFTSEGPSRLIIKAFLRSLTERVGPPSGSGAPPATTVLGCIWALAGNAADWLPPQQQQGRR